MIDLPEKLRVETSVRCRCKGCGMQTQRKVSRLLAAYNVNKAEKEIDEGWISGDITLYRP